MKKMTPRNYPVDNPPPTGQAEPLTKEDSSVQIATAGRPNFSSATPSCTLHVVHDPQQPTPTTKSPEF